MIFVPLSCWLLSALTLICGEAPSAGSRNSNLPVSMLWFFLLNVRTLQCHRRETSSPGCDGAHARGREEEVQVLTQEVLSRRCSHVLFSYSRSCSSLGSHTPVGTLGLWMLFQENACRHLSSSQVAVGDSGPHRGWLSRGQELGRFGGWAASLMGGSWVAQRERPGGPWEKRNVSFDQGLSIKYKGLLTWYL